MTHRTHRTHAAAAAIAGISQRSARQIDKNPLLPSQRKRKRHWRTRKDPLVAVWPRALELLESTPGLMAGTGLIRRVKADPTVDPWVAGLLKRMPAKKAAVAVANKLARIAWAMLVSGESHKAPKAEEILAAA